MIISAQDKRFRAGKCALFSTQFKETVLHRPISIFIAWLPVFLWALVIAVESSIGSASNTGPLLRTLLVWLFGSVEPARLDLVHGLIRKAGHFFGYGVLGYLSFRALSATLPKARPKQWAGLAVCLTFLVASLDEWHQSFLPDRTGQFMDVVLDTSGALFLVGLALFAVLMGRRAAMCRS